MLQFPIYLDHNATTPCDPRVVDAMLPYFTNSIGNAASRNHSCGWQAEEAVDYAREQVAKLVGACALWGLGGSVLQVQRLDAFGAGYVECHFCQFGHHPRHIVQTGALIAIQLDQTL